MRKALVSTVDILLELGNSRYVIMDCRFSLGDPSAGKKAYKKGHVPGAIYANLDTDLSGTITPGETGRHPLPDPADFVKKLQKWGVGNDSIVVAYDDSGGAFAARLWWMMQWLGHKQAHVMHGGWNEWLYDGLPISTRAPRRKKGAFEPDIQTDLVVDTDFVQQKLKDKTYLLIDARAAERFAGKEEPIDPVAGHIPGAINIPYAGNTDDRHKWHSSKDLKKKFKALKKYKPEKTICYCGSGVSACHNIISIVEAGYPMPRLYAGSWSEWITDPERPVET